MRKIILELLLGFLTLMLLAVLVEHGTDENFTISGAPKASNGFVDRGCKIMICAQDSTELLLWAYKIVEEDQAKTPLPVSNYKPITAAQIDSIVEHYLGGKR